MTHPSDLLERYALGQLPTPTLAAIDGHLERCPECRVLLTSPPEIDLDTVWAAISTQLESDPPYRHRQRPGRRPPPTRTGRRRRA
jgi:anti-sigma factor RsiW